jgi:hypothetical protein
VGGNISNREGWWCYKLILETGGARGVRFLSWSGNTQCDVARFHAKVRARLDYSGRQVYHGGV